MAKTDYETKHLTEELVAEWNAWLDEHAIDHIMVVAEHNIDDGFILIQATMILNNRQLTAQVATNYPWVRDKFGGHHLRFLQEARRRVVVEIMEKLIRAHSERKKP